MKKYLLIFLALFIINIIGIDNIDAAKVSSNGDFTIRGEKYNINTSKDSNNINNTVLKDLQMYDKSVTELCMYQKENNYDLTEVRYLFIYDDGSANVGWDSGYGLYGNEDNEKSMIRNWKGGITASYWNYDNYRLSEKDDAYAAYIKNKTCPFFLLLNECWGNNYIYLSSEDSYLNLANMESIAKIPKDKEECRVYKYYLYDNLSSSRNDLSCDYNYNDEKVFSLNFNNSGLPEIKMQISKGTMSPYYSIGDYTKVVSLSAKSEFKSNKYWNTVEEGKCPQKIQACLEDSESGQVIKLYGDESIIVDSNCNTKLEFNCDGNNCSSSGECGKYTDFYNGLKEKIDEYKSCKTSSCKKTALNAYNFNKNTAAVFCKSVLQNLNYSEGGCVSVCLNLSKNIEDLEVGVLKTGYSETKCNIGESVLYMVYNVLKWAKYIAPILVIILSILDFIKAIAAQNDDDMKKAQGKFVKRLMVAALLFLLPLIINFMLKTFGLYSSECDISDLFS